MDPFPRNFREGLAARKVYVPRHQALGLFSTLSCSQILGGPSAFGVIAGTILVTLPYSLARPLSDRVAQRCRTARQRVKQHTQCRVKVSSEVISNYEVRYAH